MAQKLNKKLVGFLVVSLMALMTVTGVVLIGNLPEQDPAKYAADGEKFMAEGDYDKALQSFQRAYSKDRGQNPDYLVKSAQCALELGKIAEARTLIEYAKVRDQKHKATLELDLDVEFELAPLFGSINQWNAVIERARDMQEMDEFSGSAKVHYALGRAYIELRKEDATYESKGVAELKRAIELDPANVDAVSILAKQMSTSALEKEADGEGEEAEAIRQSRRAIVSDAIEKCPDADKKSELRVLLAQCLINDGKVEEGVTGLKEIAAGETTETTARLFLGRLLTGLFSVKVTRDLPAARQYLEAALKSDPKNPLLYDAMGTVYKLESGESNDEERKVELREELRALQLKGLSEIERSKHFRKLENNNARVRFLQELILQDIGSAQSEKDTESRERFLARAEEQIESLKEERAPDSLEVRFTTARLHAERGDVIAATREAEAALASPGGMRSAPVLRLCADLYNRQGQWGAARDMVEKLIKLEPGDAGLYSGMARILLNMNQPTEALGYLKTNDPPQVRTKLESDRNAIALEVEAYRQLKDFARAGEASKRLGTEAPADEVRAAAILVWDKKYEEAEQKLKGVLASNATHEAAIRTLLQLYAESGRSALGKAFIDEIVAKNPENRRFKQLALAYSPDATGEERDKELIAFLSEEPDELIRHTSLAGFYERRGQYDKAAEALDAAEKIQPDHATIIEAQLSIALRLQNWPRAEKYAKRSADLNTDGTQGKIAEGRLALAKATEARAAGRDEEAARLTGQAIDLMKIGLDSYQNYSQGWTYLAGAYVDAGRVDEAKATLTRALQINPTNAYASMFFARIAASEGDAAVERRHLADAARTLPEDPWIQERQRFYQEKDDPATGIAFREQAREKNPDDAQNLVQLARLYADPKIGSYDQAGEAYRKALALLKNDLGLAIEVANFYGSEAVNQPVEGEQLLKSLFDAEEDKPRKALIATALGRFYEGQQVLATADRHYRQAVFLDPSVQVLGLVAEFYARTGKLEDALEQYEKLLKLSETDGEKGKEVKARMIAIFLTTGDLDRAKTMIDEFLAQYPNDPQGMIFEGAYHRIGGDIEKAKIALDAHLQKDPDNAVALWQRGQLYLLRGRWELAIEDLKKSKSLKPDAFNFQHRIALADALMEADRGEDAIAELQLILEANPDQASVAESLIDTYTRVRPARFADAENLIYRYQARFPRDHKWPMLLGQLGELAQDWDKAIAGYEKAADVGNYQPQTVRALFAAYWAANRPQKVVQFATEKLSGRVLERVPEALSALGWAYAQLQMPEKAQEAFDRALRASGSDFQVYSRIIGDIVRTLGPVEALKRAEQQSENDPDNVAKVQAMVHLLKINDRTEDALKACDRIQQIATAEADLIFAHLARGMLLNSIDKSEEARDAYEEVLKLKPDQPMALNNLAYLLSERLALPAEALPYAQKAAQLQPREPNVLDTYGWTLYLNGRHGEAAGTLLRAIEQEGDRTSDAQKSAEVRYHLGVLYREQGRLEDAQAMLEMAKKIAQVQGRKDDLPKKIEQALRETQKAAGFPEPAADVRAER